MSLRAMDELKTTVDQPGISGWVICAAVTISSVVSTYICFLMR